MRGKLLLIGPLLLVFSAAAGSQTLSEYGALGANLAAETSKALDSATKAADVLGTRPRNSTPRNSTQHASSRGSATGQTAGQPTHSSPSEELMLSNRRTLEQAAKGHGAALLVTCATEGATLFVDHRAIAPAPAFLVLPAGKHILELKSPGYMSWRRAVSVSAGDKLKFEPELQESKQVPSNSRIVNLPF